VSAERSNSFEFNKLKPALGRSGRFVAFVAMWALVTAACRESAVKPAGTGAQARDLLLITIDTLRADRLGVYGGPAGVTPALDALGHRGAVFLDATAHVPLTLPSHVSILTGRYPVSHGVHDNSGFSLPDTVPTLASTLHAAGYHTAAFVSSFVLRGSTGLARGFDTYDDRFEGAGRAHLTISSLERRAPEVAREAARWLTTARRPYFLWVHFYDPHAPYDAPAAFAARFPGRPYDAEVATSDFGVSTVLGALKDRIEHVDDARSVGEVERVEKAGSMPGRTVGPVIVATGDHGESLGEHGEAEHGILLYDATLHVPLIVAGPDVPSGSVVREQVRHVDLLPTVLDLLGFPPPAAIDGTSLVPRFRGSSVHPEPPLSHAESRFGELHFGWSPLRSVRDGTWKYIDAPAPELYDLRVDAGERDNRQGARPETAAALARTLRQMAVAGNAVSHQAPAGTADAAERLRSLGYVGGRVGLESGRAPAGGPADPKQEIGRYEAYVAAFNAGMTLLEERRPREAEARFRTLVRSYPRAFEPHQYLARSLTARGSYADAMREFDLAIALAPNEAVLYFDAARTQAEASRFDAALASVEAGLRLEPSSFYGWLTRGLVAGAAGRRTEAEQAYREALRLNPVLAVAHFELGRLAEQGGDRSAARAEYRLALDEDATLTEARQALDRIAR
jgi:choline-sulfatase